MEVKDNRKDFRGIFHGFIGILKYFLGIFKDFLGILRILRLLRISEAFLRIFDAFLRKETAAGSCGRVTFVRDNAVLLGETKGMAAVNV